MDENKPKRVPSLQEYIDGFTMPRYLDDPRSFSIEAIQAWYQKIENRYYELYGQEKIESLRIGSRKEGE